MKKLNTATPVVVLGANTHGSLGIIRSLGELGIPVYGTHAGIPGPATSSRFCRGAFCWKYPGSGTGECVEQLIAIAKQIGRPAILIPTWDETAVWAAEHYEELSSWFILPRQSPELAHTLVDKQRMFHCARQHGIPTAEIIVPHCADDVEAFAAQSKFPVLLKGIDGNRLKRRSGRKMVIADSAEELLRLYGEMEDGDQPNLMLQEYIPSSPGCDWMLNAYFDEDSDCLFRITGRKIRQTPVYTGMTSLGICESNAIIATRTIQWMKKVGYRGILDIGYRYDSRDGEYKVLDVNPRIGATFRLFVADNGMDVARALYRDLTSQSVPTSKSQHGRKWLVELDFKSCIDYYRDGNLGLTEWWQSIRDVAEFGYFRRDDLRPFLHFLMLGARKFGLPLPDIARQFPVSTCSTLPTVRRSAVSVSSAE